MMNLIDTRSVALFDESKFADARFTISFQKWWTRGLFETTSIVLQHKTISILKTKLKWNSLDGDKKWIDRHSVPLLFYATLCDSEDVVREILKDIDDVSFNITLPVKGFPSFGLTGRCTCLQAAISVSTPEMVALLLNRGADPYV